MTQTRKPESEPQREYLLLIRGGMAKEPYLEHLLKDHVRGSSFKLGGFRTLEDPPKKQESREEKILRSRLARKLNTDREMRVLYHEFEQTQRALEELEIAERMLRTEVIARWEQQFAKKDP